MFKQKSIYNISLIIGLILNIVLLFRNILYYVKDEFFWVESGIITEEMNEILKIRFAIADVIYYIDTFFVDLFIVAIFLLVFWANYNKLKFNLLNIFTIIIVIIISFISNIELSILTNSHASRVNYYDILMQFVFIDTRHIIFIAISVAVIIFKKKNNYEK